MPDRWDVPPFPGAIGVSHLRVYDSEAPDGLKGGTPHVHSACTEAYYVVAGHGAVQTLTMAGFDEIRLEPGRFVWFTPGTIHRLLNTDGELEILVLMANAGLPEAGDMVITFPTGVLADPVRYRDASALPDGETTTTGSGRSARTRRDLGVEGFLPLRDAVVGGNPEPLERFYERAAAILAPKARGWSTVFASTIQAMHTTKTQIDAIRNVDPSHLHDASVHQLPPPSDERRMGCCGTLGTYLPSS